LIVAYYSSLFIFLLLNYRLTPLELAFEIARLMPGVKFVPTQLLRSKAGATAIREAIAKGA
jgi:hypothetical protein